MKYKTLFHNVYEYSIMSIEQVVSGSCVEHSLNMVIEYIIYCYYMTVYVMQLMSFQIK